MKKKSITIEDLLSVKIPVRLNGCQTFIRSVKPFGIGNDCYTIEVRNDIQCEYQSDIILPYSKEYNTCARAINRWIKKELTKE